TTRSTGVVPRVPALPPLLGQGRAGTQQKGEQATDDEQLSTHGGSPRAQIPRIQGIVTFNPARARIASTLINFSEIICRKVKIGPNTGKPRDRGTRLPQHFLGTEAQGVFRVSGLSRTALGERGHAAAF